MLLLKNIKKTYALGSNNTSNALDGVSLAFRKNEFVAILGPSGSGKTTLLNIIGGLDQYTEGDLVINGKSTKNFSDGDWDTYRNHSVGFVFQSYNLIPHQSVLANVELALTLSGVSRKERRARAKEALERVGLSEHISKRPNQMSGGQMQRVAIARALVNNPDILLADEPTGALDSVTSVQIMELLKEVSKDRLVIMVTHNPELADQYANRIVRLKDGKIVADTNPFIEQQEQDNSKKVKKPSMSLFTALSLSLNNLMTKKARTFLTSFAGSIGIIGIAAILALSNGVNAYISQVQEETLSSYPVQIQAEQKDMSSMILGIMGSKDKSEAHGKDAVYASSVMYDLANSFNNASTITNDLESLKTYFENENCDIDSYTRTIQYLYNVPLNIYAKNADGKYQKSDIMEVFSGMSEGSTMENSMGSMSEMYGSFSSFNSWAELLPGTNGAPVSDMISDQYELVAGSWPTKKEHIILVLDSNNEITDITLHALGLKSTDKIIADMIAAEKGETVEMETASYSYEDILATRFKLICSPDYYSKKGNVWEDVRKDSDAMDVIISKGLDLEIAGIIRPKEDAASTFLGASLYYTHDLTKYIINYTNDSEIVKAQKDEANKNLDVLTGLPFVLENEVELTNQEAAKEMRDYFATLTEKEKAEMFIKVKGFIPEKTLDETVEQYMSAYPDRESLEKMIFERYSSIAGLDEDSIRSFIAEYSDEELREMVEEQIRQVVVNQKMAQAEKEAEQIASAPSDEELAQIKGQITAKLTDRNTKTMYLVSEYTKATNMPAQTVMMHLMSLTDEQIDQEVDKLVTESAKAMYSSMAGAAQGGADKKVAAAFDKLVLSMKDEELAEMYDECMPPKTSSSTLKENLKSLGVTSTDSPSSINIYVSTFEDKDKVAALIKDYNASVGEEKEITYTDFVAIIMSSVTTIINAITYVLIAFVSISLVVSSIMIGIITYISVLERTKEIGILRAIGASKRDISRVFNAETLIIGFTSGLIGILATILICIPANAIIRSLSGIENLTAYLPIENAVFLIAVSVVLTVIAGLFPARIAAKKDPVVALRTE